MSDQTIQDLRRVFAHLEPQFGVELAPFTYFKIGGPAEIMILAKSRDVAIEVVQLCAKHHVPLTVLGGASNVVIESKGVPGVTLRMGEEFYQRLPELTSEGAVQVEVSSGYRTGPFVRKTIDDGLTGLEYFLGVPGRVGGAVFNNAHYLADLIGEHVTQVEVVTKQGDVRWLTQVECQFAYDSSVFHRTQDVILRVRFALHPGNREASLERVKEATLYRSRTQPLGEPSSGCYFRNVPNTPELRARFPQYAERAEFPSAFLIDQAGLKGQQVGQVKVSEKHAAFLINVGGGTSDDVHKLAEMIRAKVAAEFGATLVPEVFTLPTTV